MPPNLPVPAVKGGAIETLIQNLIDINEIEKKAKITILTIEDSVAKKLHNNYKLTEFVEFKGTDRMSSLEIIVQTGLRGIRKYLKLPIQIKSNYMKEVEKYILNNYDNFDCIINESFEPYGFNKISNKLGRNRLFIHLHCYLRADKYLDKIYGHVITVSDYIKQKWMENSDRNSNDVIVLKNGIDTIKFDKHISEKERKTLRNNLNIKEDDFVVLFCGRIVQQKGIKELILAINKLKNKKIKLLIIGSPNFGVKIKSEFLDNIKSMVDENKEKICFTGFVENSILYKYYGISDILVVPSTYEDPAPLVPIEGMANGIPMIVTNTGGAWEYVNDKCAIKVYKEHDLVKQLEISIEELFMAKDKLSLMSKESKKCSEKFTSRAYYSMFIKIMEIV